MVLKQIFIIRDSVQQLIMEDSQSVYSELINGLDFDLEEGEINNKQHLFGLAFLEMAFNSYINDRLNGVLPETDIRREINCTEYLKDLHRFDGWDLELTFEMLKADDRDGQIRYTFSFM